MAPPVSCKWKWMVSVCKNLPTLHIFHINTNGYYDDFIFSTFLLNLIFSHYILLWSKTFFFAESWLMLMHVLIFFRRTHVQISAHLLRILLVFRVYLTVFENHQKCLIWIFYAKLILILCFIFAKLCQMRLFE